MADRRMLSTLVAEDEDLNRLSIEAHLLFLMIIPHLDRDGLITGHPRLLHSRATPLRTELIDRTGELIEELIRAGLIIRYDTSRPTLFFPSFRRHQIGMHYEDEKPSKHPPPPGYTRSGAGLVPDDPDQAQQLALCFDPRSNYAKALLASISRDTRDHIATTSRDGRVSRSRSMSKSMQTPISDDDDDQFTHSPPPDYRKEGGPGGNQPHAKKADRNNWMAFEAHQLRTILDNVASLLAVETDFAGSWHTYIEALNFEQLIDWIEWCYFYGNRPADPTAEDKVRSYPAVIRAHIRKQESAPLTPRQRADLLNTVAKYAHYKEQQHDATASTIQTLATPR